MTKESLMEVRRMLGEIDDLIYRDARSRGLADHNEEFQYTEEETVLTTIVDEAQGQTTKMIEAFA